MAFDRSRQQNVEVILAPRLPGQPDRAGSVGGGDDVKIGAGSVRQTNDIGPGAGIAGPGARRVTAIANLPVAVDLLAPRYPHVALAIDGHGRTPDAQAVRRRFQGRLPHLAVEAPQQDLIAVVLRLQFLESAGLDALHDNRPARLIGDISQPDRTVLALGRGGIIVLGLRSRQTQSRLLALHGNLSVQVALAVADREIAELELELACLGRDVHRGRLRRIQADIHTRPDDDLAFVLLAHHRARAKTAIGAGLALAAEIALDFDNAPLGNLDGAIPDGAFLVFQSRTKLQVDHVRRHGQRFDGGAFFPGRPFDRRLVLFGRLSAAESDNHEHDHGGRRREGTPSARGSHDAILPSRIRSEEKCAVIVSRRRAIVNRPTESRP
jgi:hypothetical protein